MKQITGIGWYECDNKSILIVSEDYKGSPLICCLYDILICSEKIFNKYKNSLIMEHMQTKYNWHPIIKII